MTLLRQLPAVVLAASVPRVRAPVHACRVRGVQQRRSAALDDGAPEHSDMAPRQDGVAKSIAGKLHARSDRYIRCVLARRNVAVLSRVANNTSAVHVLTVVQLCRVRRHCALQPQRRRVSRLRPQSAHKPGRPCWTCALQAQAATRPALAATLPAPRRRARNRALQHVAPRLGACPTRYTACARGKWSGLAALPRARWQQPAGLSARPERPHCRPAQSGARRWPRRYRRAWSML